jgi:hypothetical protein
MALLISITGLVALLIFLAWGCTIRIEPLGYKPPVRKVAKKYTSHRRAASQDSMYVSPGWLSEYHQMEAEQGGYAR